MIQARPDQTRVLTPQESLHPEPLSHRIQMWKNNEKPHTKPGDKRNKEQKAPPAKLSELGQRLLGLKQW